MGAAVSITRLDLTASELRKAASGEKDSAAAHRILALALNPPRGAPSAIERACRYFRGFARDRALRW